MKKWIFALLSFGIAAFSLFGMSEIDQKDFRPTISYKNESQDTFSIPYEEISKLMSKYQLYIQQLRESDSIIPYGTTVPEESDTFYIAVEKMPEIIGGIETIQRRIRYPESAKHDGVEGTVFLRVFVDEKGNVAKVEIARGVRDDLNQAAMDAVKPTQFEPGEQRGVPVPVRVSIPIHFRLARPEVDEDEIKEPTVEVLQGPENLAALIDYPQEAIREKAQGFVYAVVILNEQRRIAGIRIERGLGYGADEAVISALAKYKFYEDPQYEDVTDPRTVPIIVLFRLPRD